jgi:hypothetical protein
MKTLEYSLNYQSLKAFLHELLLQARRADEMDLLVEVLLTISCTNAEISGSIPHDDPDSTFDILLSSSCGKVWIGVIKGINEAKKVLLFLHATQAGRFFLYNASARNMTDLPRIAVDREEISRFHSTDESHSGVVQMMEARDENLVAAFISSGS